MDYKEKLRLAKEALDSGSYDKETIEYIFPELKESEDEKIRKWLIAIVNERCFPACSHCIEQEIGEKAIAWLEKQGEQKPVEWSEEDEEEIWNKAKEVFPDSGNMQSGFVSGYKEAIQILKPQSKQEWSEEDDRMCKALIDNIQAICEEGYFVGNIGSDELIKYLKSLKDRILPQPKQEWSEEDRKYLDSAIQACYACYDESSNTAIWLKSLKDRVQSQPKQEWSEEDKQYLLVCKNALYKYQSTDKWDAGIIYRWLEDKLKSLRPQKHWKPSEEQITALDNFIYAKYPDTERYSEPIKSLYNDLKKLREEQL